MRQVLICRITIALLIIGIPKWKYCFRYPCFNRQSVRQIMNIIIIKVPCYFPGEFESNCAHSN